MKRHTAVFTLRRRYKILILSLIDLITLAFSLLLAIVLRLSEIFPINYLQSNWLLIVTTPLIAYISFLILGQYRTVLRYMQIQSIYLVATGVTASALSMYLIAYLNQISPFSRSIPIIYSFVAIILVGTSRLAMKAYYSWIMSHLVPRRPVLIYGAGAAGAQLARALKFGDLSVVGFIDDDPNLKNISVAGIKIFGPESLRSLINEYHVERILLAMPSISKHQTTEIIQSLTNYPVRVQTAPTQSELLSGIEVDSLRDVALEDLLGRSVVTPDPMLIGKNVNNCSVMITGAGGSIGSELCKQVLLQNPRSLVLYEISEYALYQVESALLELHRTHQINVKIYPILGCVTDFNHLTAVIERFKIETIYHAAAFKHVPLVEQNILQGIKNNVLGTWVCARAAHLKSVKQFTLVSTDKAVRPTNVMGATKRFAELVLQALSVQSCSTIYSMVRFGNVLGSSGSVVPLFKKQIAEGGPVTVTHPEITRFFMTIPEAAQLVLQAGSLAKGGEVFVLDMGLPIKIIDLAKNMIHLMGFRTASEKCESESEIIEVTFTGLRPGEKLYEELLINDNAIQTNHPKIMMAQESFIELQQIEKYIESFMQALESNNVKLAVDILKAAVPEYNASSESVDLLSNEL